MKMKPRRIYDGMTLADWDIPVEAVLCPEDPAARAQWGWQQDHSGQWYRDLPAGSKLSDPPQPQPQPA
jgi:hypothetical protein